MNYSSFLEQILPLVQDRLPAGIQAEFRKVSKNNGVTCTGMHLCPGRGTGASPLVYMEPYHARLEEELERGASEKTMHGAEASAHAVPVEGAPVGIALDGTESAETDPVGTVSTAAVLAGLAAEITEALLEPVPEALTPSRFTDPAYVRENVVFRLVNRERNCDMLPRLLSRPFLDLAVTYGVFVHSPETGSGITMVRKNMAEEWGLTEEDLFEAALANTPRILGEDLRSMAEILGQTGDLIQDGMYVLSNREAFYGAGALLYTSSLRKLSAALGTDLYILPSSVHEVILTPKQEENADFLCELVREVNENEVKREEILSDSVYLYDRMEDRIVLAASLSAVCEPEE